MPFWYAPLLAFPPFSSTEPGPSGYMPMSGFMAPFGASWPNQAQREKSTVQSGDREATKPSEDTEVEGDTIELLDESEALELVEFDPSVDPKDTCDPMKPIASFLDKHFNRALSDSEREAILKDFPKPNC